MTIIDTHAHIDQIEDFDGMVERALKAGVTDVVAMSVDLASMQKVLELAKRSQALRIHPALGIHPGTIKPEEQQQALDFMQANISVGNGLPAGRQGLKPFRPAAIGETGLDYWYKWVRKDEVERQKQKDSFQVHLELAKAHDLPIVIHSRGAWKECLSMAQNAGVTKALFHWYSGPVDVMTQILDQGYYVSTSPSVGYSDESRRAMSAAPIERILIETDSPVRYRSESGDYIAEPKDVWNTLKFLSLLKQMDEPAVLDAVNANARKFFGIV